MNEEWKPVPGYPGYEASSLGRVRSSLRSARRVLRPHYDDSGYLRIRVRENGRWVGRRVHQLVALAFLGPRPAGGQVRHLDGSRLNNVPSNLRWGTYSENTYDKVQHGTHPMASKTHCKHGHPFDAANTKRNKHGWRLCRACSVATSRRYQERRAREAAGIRGRAA